MNFTVQDLCYMWSQPVLCCIICCCKSETTNCKHPSMTAGVTLLYLVINMTATRQQPPAVHLSSPSPLYLWLPVSHPSLVVRNLSSLTFSLFVSQHSVLCFMYHYQSCSVIQPDKLVIREIVRIVRIIIKTTIIHESGQYAIILRNTIWFI